MAVEYRTIEGLIGYRFGSDGSVWTDLERIGSGPYKSTGRWRLKVASRGANGRLHTSIRVRSGKLKSLTIHRLIATAFLGPCPVGKECCHDNGNPDDNRVENLRWDTRSANHLDKRRHGTDNGGERNKQAKFTNEQVNEIRRLYAAGNVTQRQLAKRYGVTNQSIWSMIHGVTYADS